LSPRRWSSRRRSPAAPAPWERAGEGLLGVRVRVRGRVRVRVRARVRVGVRVRDRVGVRILVKVRLRVGEQQGADGVATVDVVLHAAGARDLGRGRGRGKGRGRGRGKGRGRGRGLHYP